MQKWQCMRKILFNQLELYRHNEIQNGNCNFGWLYVVRGERWAENVYKFGKCVEAEEILKMRDRLNREIAKETGQTYEKVVNDTEPTPACATFTFSVFAFT